MEPCPQPLMVWELKKSWVRGVQKVGAGPLGGLICSACSRLEIQTLKRKASLFSSLSQR